MKAPSPAFSLYPKDMLTDEHVSAMTHTEFGIYIRLLLHAWLEGSIPSEPVKLCRILKLNRNMFNRLWVAVAPCFQERDGRLFQQRLEAEREKQLVRSEENRRKGLLGGRPMKSTKQESPGFVPAKPRESLPSPSPFPSSIQTNGMRAGIKNPLLDGKRPALESEALRLVRAIQELTGEDGVEIIREASSYKDRDGKLRQGQTNPATMSDDRLLATVKDLRETLEVERGKHGRAQ